ncbi:MAG: hypothetical protein K0S53_2700 [Bacteroidetes bacterium]|jgi:hypothetical protein|nr:hypothetical protein [Bacteroidota bacterium]
MTHTDKIELQSLKSVLTSMQIDRPSHLSRVLSDINLSLTYESILLYRNLNELFLCLHINQSVNTEDFYQLKSRLINQIDSMISKNSI